MTPLQHAIYKGTGGKFGAIQFNLQSPHYYKGKQKDFTGKTAFVDGKLAEGWRQREGCVFLEITSAKDKNVYDWTNKVILALSVNDLGKCLMALVYGEECKIMHDPGAKSESAGDIKKYLSITSPKGVKVGCLIKVAKQENGETVSHTVPLSGEEVIVLRTLFQSAISKALNW